MTRKETRILELSEKIRILQKECDQLVKKYWEDVGVVRSCDPIDALPARLNPVWLKERLRAIRRQQSKAKRRLAWQRLTLRIFGDLGAKAEPINMDELMHTWSSLIFIVWYGFVALDIFLLWIGSSLSVGTIALMVIFSHVSIMCLGILAASISEDSRRIFSQGLFYGLKRIGVTKGLVGHLTMLMLGAFASTTILHIIAFAQDNLAYLVASFMAEFIFATSGAICIFTKKITEFVKNRYEQRQVF